MNDLIAFLRLSMGATGQRKPTAGSVLCGLGHMPRASALPTWKNVTTESAWEGERDEDSVERNV